MLSAHILARSRAMREYLIRALRQWRPISPVREHYLHTHPEELSSLVQQMPGGQRLLMLPDAIAGFQKKVEPRPLTPLEEQKQPQAQVALQPLEERETELLRAISPSMTEPIPLFSGSAAVRQRTQPPREGVSFYQWPEETQYRNLAEMLSNAVLEHRLRHTYKPTRITVSPWNYRLAHIWKSCEPYRSVLFESKEMTRDSVVCEGPSTIEEGEQARHV